MVGRKISRRRYDENLETDQGIISGLNISKTESAFILREQFSEVYLS